MITDLDIAKKLMRIAQSAENRNIKFDMSFAKVKKLMNTKKCFFTGVELDKENNGAPNYITFDRVDADGGYTDDNVVACSNEFNQKKKDITISDIKTMYEKCVKMGFIPSKTKAKK